MDELTPLIGSRILIKKLWTAYNSRYSVSASKQKPSYAITENRRITNYPYVGCSIYWYADKPERFTEGDMVIAQVMCPLRHFQPISLTKETHVTLNEVLFNENHAYLERTVTLHTGDIGRQITIHGGTTTWVDLGIYLVTFTRSISQDTNDLILDDVRFAKPVFEFNDEFGEGASGVYTPFVEYTFSPLCLYNMFHSYRCRTRLIDGGQTLALSGGIVNLNITENSSASWVTLDTVVSLPDGLAGYNVLCVELDIVYKAEVYRHSVFEPFLLESIEMGTDCNVNGVITPNLQRSRYVLYDAYSKTNTFYIYTTINQTNIIHLNVFLIPCYEGNDYPLPTDMTNDAGTFLMRVGLRIQTSHTIKDHVTFNNIRAETNLVPIETSKLPHDLTWGSGYNVLI